MHRPPIPHLPLAVAVAAATILLMAGAALPAAARGTATTPPTGRASVAMPIPDRAPAPPMQAHTDTEHVVLSSRPSSDRRGQALSAQLQEEPVAQAALLGPNRRAEERTVPAFDAIGLTLDSVHAPPSDPLFVRGQVDGTWSPWFEVTFAEQAGPDPSRETTRPGLHSDPVWLGDATAYEVDAPEGVDDVAVHLVRESPAPAALRGAAAAPAADVRPAQPAGGPIAAGDVPRPGIASRASWNARPPAETPSYTADLRIAVVHHSAGSNTYSLSQVPAVLRSIQAYHMDVRGWNDIAYNFAVDRFGRTWEARAGGIDRVAIGGHARGFNTGSVGVVVLGDFSSAAAPAAAIESVSRVIAWKFAVHRVDPTTTVPYTTTGSSKYAAGTTVTLPRVVGHRDTQLTGCPGTALYSKLPAIRARVTQLIQHYQQNLPAAVVSGDFTADGLLDALEYRAGPMSDTRWSATGDGHFTRTPAPVNGAYRPATGDFDGDGRDDILWHGTGSTPDFIWWSRASGVVSQPIDVRGSYQPVIGDYDGNGRDDILWYSAGPGADSVWFFSGTGYRSAPTVQDLITGQPLVGDFNADGRSDILWYGPGPDADDTLWLGQANQTYHREDLSVNGHYLPTVLDATGDGIDDVVWFAPGGTSYRWAFDDTGQPTSRSLGSTNLMGSPTAGDLDGDGRDDLLLAAPGSASDAIWYSSPTGTSQATVSINGSYAVLAGPVGGASDDLLFISTAGGDYLWSIDAARTVSSARVG